MPIILILGFLFLQGCVGTYQFQAGANRCNVLHKHATWYAAYGTLTCLDENGKLVAAAITKGKSLGEVGLNVAGAVGMGVGAYQGLKAVQTGTEVVIGVTGR